MKPPQEGVHPPVHRLTGGRPLLPPVTTEHLKFGARPKVPILLVMKRVQRDRPFRRACNFRWCPRLRGPIMGKIFEIRRILWGRDPRV